VRDGHRGVQARDGHPELRHGEQRPRLRSVKQRPVKALVELVEQLGVVLQLGEVGSLGLDVPGLALQEVAMAGGPGHVMAAGDDEQPVGFQPEQHPQSGEKRQRVVPLPGSTGLHEVAGDEDQIGSWRAGIGELRHIGPDPCLQVTGSKRLGDAAPEPGPRHVQQRDSLARGRYGGAGARIGWGHLRDTAGARRLG
jgi:hypothetical protein